MRIFSNIQLRISNWVKTKNKFLLWWPGLSQVLVDIWLNMNQQCPHCGQEGNGILTYIRNSVGLEKWSSLCTLLWWGSLNGAHSVWVFWSDFQRASSLWEHLELYAVRRVGSTDVSALADEIVQPVGGTRRKLMHHLEERQDEFTVLSSNMHT